MQIRRARRGNVMLYAAIALPVLCGVLSLTVDFGMVQLTRSELQSAADAAARYAATGLDAGGPHVVRSRAAESANENAATFGSGSLAPDTRVEFGIWHADTRTFTTVPPNEESSASAIRVNIEFKKEKGNSLTLPLARFIGMSDIDIVRSAVVTRGKTITPTVGGKACPWLAGMPVGSSVVGNGGNNHATTGEEHHPVLVPLNTFSTGDALRFRQTTGTTSMINYEDLPMDGKADWVVRQNAANGINASKIPIGALVGIFLNDNAPNTSPMAPEMDFSSPASRNFTELRPQLKQVFFIGDGLTTGGTLQNFYPPAGATRLYLGIMDEKGWWWDNTGHITTNLLDSTVTTVK